MKHILLPTDFSKISLNAMKYAVSFFADIPAKFYLLHVSLHSEDSETTNFQPSNVIEDTATIEHTQVQLQADIRKLKLMSNSKKHQFYGIHKKINFMDAIRTTVLDMRIDYIVMGTKGFTKREGTVLGSFTADVITKVQCTIMVIPEKVRYRTPNNLLFPTDFNGYFKSKVLGTLSDILKMKNSKLNVLYISKIDKDLSLLQKKNREYLQDYLQDKPHSFYFITESALDDAVQTFVESTDVDMITMVAKNLNYFQRILFHPALENINYHTKLPFLVLHE